MVNVFVVAMLTINNQVLMVKRQNASFGDGLYSLVGGKVERGETALSAICREVREETTLDIPEDAFTLVHTLHRKGTEAELIALCFKADINALSAPYNNEPDKCSDMRFFTFDVLPKNIIPAHAQVIRCVQQGTIYSQHGW
jgi:8-oxo-dGTP diphosphatase